MTDPLVTVVMPLYNHEAYVAEAIESVCTQTFQAWQLIVVDDGSTDDSWAVARGTLERFSDSVQASLVTSDMDRRLNCGTAAAINRGVDVAFVGEHGHEPTPYLTWVSSDNLMHPKWLERLMKVFSRPRLIGAAYSGFVRADLVIGLARGSGARMWRPRGRRFNPYVPDKLINGTNSYFGPSFLMRSNTWLEAGTHRGGAAHDYDHWCRVEEVCWRRGQQIVGLDEVLCTYRTHPNQAVKLRPELADAKKWQREAIIRRGL